MVAAVELIHVSKVYNADGNPVRALCDVNLEIERGAMLSVMGPSGSGKSTLMKVAAGFLRPEKGRVNLSGNPVYELPLGQRLRLRRTVGFMFQEDYLIETLSLLENVELPLIISGIPKRERRETAEKVLECVGLFEIVERLPHEISGGERRRASLARSLVNEPEILFADEPTSNLDSRTALMIVDLLRQLNKGGTTVLISTHDGLVAERVGAVTLIRDGIISSKNLTPMEKSISKMSTEIPIVDESGIQSPNIIEYGENRVKLRLC